ncbi:MAG: acyltransferase [Candidatus Micrarchaeia archaeon]
MRRNIECHRTEGRNSLWQWWRVRNPIRLGINFIILEICKYIPSLAVKNALYTLLGVKVGKNVAIGLCAQLDVFFPELIEIGDNTIIGYDALILTHEFLPNEWRAGRVKIGKNVLIGARSIVLPGITIGDNAIISAGSLVNRNVEPNSFVGGIPAKKIASNHNGSD